MKTSLKCTASIIALSIVTASAGAAFAQSADNSNGENAVAEVVVTGSRVATGADAPTPVTVVTTEAINQVSLPNVADALIQLPSLRTSTSSSKGGQGATVGAQLNLRNLGQVRTLVLVDGQRFVATPGFATSQTQAVNIDNIPQGLIKRIETVTGGASAAYGSDAVAGVVNFVLDKNFEGLKGEANYGQTSRNDGQHYNGIITAGGAFADGKGHVVFDAEYAKDDGIDNDPLGFTPARPFQSDARTIGRERVGATYQIIQGARLAQVPLNGIVAGCTQNGVLRTGATASLCAVNGTYFNDAGTATQVYNQGVRTSPTSVFAVGGDGYRPGPQSVLDTPSTRSSLYARVGYDVTSKLNVYFSAQSAKTLSYSEAGSGTPSLIIATGLPIQSDYAYLPSDLSAALKANNISSINMQKYFNFNVQQTFENRLNRVVFGGNYQFNDNWSADLYYTYGETRDSLKLGNFTNDIALKNSLDAVTVTALNQGTSGLALGSVACRSTLTSANNGCVPWNIFGNAPLTAAQQNYINPTDYYFTNNSQQVIEGSIKGSPFALPAGKVDVAFGAGYRKEALNEATDTLGLASQKNPYSGNPGALIYINSPAIKGALDLGEVFTEAQVPLLKDQFLAKSLELNLAARYTDYSTSGGVTTWKAGAVWVPVDGVRFRAAQSRDVRAANVVELYSPSSTSFASVFDYVQQRQYSIIPVSSGNANLTPEKADTSTIGVVLNPTFWPSVYASVDYFNIKLNDEIAPITSQVTLNNCQAGNQLYCARIIRDPVSTNITTILTPYSNLNIGHNQGVDVELGYQHAIDQFGLNGNFAARLFATYQIKNSVTTPGAPATTINGVTTPAIPATVVPNQELSARTTLLGTADYRQGPWTFGLQEHYVSGGRFDVTVIRYTGDTASSQLWTDISIKRKMGKWELYGAVINLFDKDPPQYPFTAPSSGLGSSSLFDVQGRRYTVGARFKL
jgi:iron complex outermembrane receptor protein